MASVELKNVSKTYDQKVQAVNNANLTIEDKEFVVLVGPSGCGKSTLLRMIAGLEDITEGDIFIDDKKVNFVPAKDRDIAMVFQNYALYPHMTVFENMAFGLKLRKIPKKEIEDRVNNAAKLLHITEILDRKPKALSGGQRQRVAVGRAIVRKPKVFLFDEPLSNLDAKLRVQTRIEISRLHQNLQTTMIYVTHDQVEAMTMGSKIVVLKDGLIQQINSPLNLYNNPVNRFVAGFIGSPAMNFFEGSLEKKDSLYFKSDLFQLALDDKLFSYLTQKAGGDIVLGIRPEDIMPEAPDNAEWIKLSEAIKIEVIEPIGNEIILYFGETENSHCIRTGADKLYRVNDALPLSFRKNRLYFFDLQSGERIRET
ncbi:MAG: sn-glycerol-3-phosphate ABC transporter ATP-binding protein UgpC [Calditrichales bacterium]|nr:MAG: sn-glycerol-3-phosphate ABC transporter ATP-binding protein UgpC [Calditrichales bacterium]